MRTRNKIFYLVAALLISSLIISLVYAAGTFGYTTKGTGYGTLTNRIKGSKYYLSEKAYAQSITTYLLMNGGSGSGKVRCAIYSTDLVLLATTEEIDVAEDYDGWETFSFSSPPLLAIGYYWLVAWGNTPVTGEFRMYMDANATDQLVYQIETYTGDFPNPLGTGEYFGYYPYNMSIYCAYETWSEEEEEERGEEGADITILNLPYQFGEKLGISTWSAGMLLTALLLFPFNVILILWQKGGIIALIFNLTLLGIFTSFGWLPPWTILVIGLIVVGLYAANKKDVF